MKALVMHEITVNALYTIIYNFENKCYIMIVIRDNLYLPILWNLNKIQHSEMYIITIL